MPSSTDSKKSIIVSVGARPSLLSKAQVEEVLQELRRHHPYVTFDVQYVVTLGDKDQKTSLRTLDKTDFFTKEIDDLILQGTCRVGIHSAKDLPEPLTPGLALICLTKGIDSSDSLVLRAGETLQSLRKGALIATSSQRREDNVRRLRDDFHFMDIRGTIEERLAKLYLGKADGVVIAEAALIRLDLTALNRVRLPGATVPGQGRLAIVARADDNEMNKLFACMDDR